MCRGTNITNIADSDVVEMVTLDTPPMFLSGTTQSIEGVILSACRKVTLQMRVRVFPAMERPELVIVTTGSSGTACGEGGDPEGMREGRE